MEYGRALTLAVRPVAGKKFGLHEFEETPGLGSPLVYLLLVWLCLIIALVIEKQRIL